MTTVNVPDRIPDPTRPPTTPPIVLTADSLRFLPANSRPLLYPAANPEPKVIRVNEVAMPTLEKKSLKLKLL